MTQIDREILKRVISECIELLCRHFFPNGKKVKNEWVLGNLQGDKGQSLHISLLGDKCSVFHDFASGESGDFVTAVMLSRNLDFITAALEIGQAAGVNVTMEDQPARQHRSGPRFTTTGSIKPPDWDRDYRLSESDIEELATWRRYSIEFCRWADTNRLIGRRRGGRQWAFPVYDGNGKIVSAHIRFSKNEWKYRPELKDLGLRTRPLIVGDVTNTEKIFIPESQWDGFAVVDKLGIQHGERVAVFCTRGCSNAGLVTELQIGLNGASAPPELYVVPQNDEHGQDWALKIDENLSGACRLLAVPEKFHDANDWLRDPDNITEFIEAIRHAELRQRTADQRPSSQPPPRIYIECHRPSYYMAYEPPPDLVLCGDNHIVRGAAFVIGGAPGVGKSRASTAFALAGALRAPWFGLETLVEFRTLIIQTENGRFRLKKEFTAINQPELEDHLMICPPPPYGLCFGKKEFRDQLRFYQDNHAPHVVMLDPWNAVAFDDKIADYRTAFDVVREVFDIGSEKGPALGILAHTRKPIAGERVNGRALLSLLAGSYVLGSIPRCVFVMQSASDDVDETRVVWTCCKNNDGRLGPQTAWERRNGLFVPASDFDWDEFRNPEDGRSKRRIKSTVEDLFALVPADVPILKDDLYAHAYGKISQNDFRKYLAELLREARIFIHRIKRQGIKPATAYCRKPPKESEPDSDIDDHEPDESDIEDDPR